MYHSKYLIHWVIWIWRNGGAGRELAKWNVLTPKQRKANQREVELLVPRLPVPCDLPHALLHPFPTKGFPPPPRLPLNNVMDTPPSTCWKMACCRGSDAAPLEQIPVCKRSVCCFPSVRRRKLQGFESSPAAETTVLLWLNIIMDEWSSPFPHVSSPNRLWILHW